MRTEQAAPAAVLDVEGTLARFGGDKQLFVEMATFLIEDAPHLFAGLRNAATEGDAARTESKAHALKGLLANCGGVRAARVAQLLEDAGRTGQLNNASALLETLEDELATLSKAVAAYQP